MLVTLHNISNMQRSYLSGQNLGSNQNKIVLADTKCIVARSKTDINKYAPAMGCYLSLSWDANHKYWLIESAKKDPIQPGESCKFDSTFLNVSADWFIVPEHCLLQILGGNGNEWIVQCAEYESES